jgi:hypothetical protein
MDDATPIVESPIKPPRRFRRTRIAVSVFFGVVTFLLCVMWVRSYWWGHSAVKSIAYDKAVVVISASGRYHVELIRVVKSHRAGRAHVLNTRRIASVPHWFPVFIASGLVVASWRSIHFSLRTLLLVMTLISLWLGLGVWLTR